MIDNELLKIESGDAIFERGEKHFKEYPNNNISFVLLESSLLCRGKIKKYDCELKLSFENGSILDSSCNCMYFKKNKLVCKHLVAFAMQINKKMTDTLHKRLSSIDFEKRAELVAKKLEVLNSKMSNNTENPPKSVSDINKRIKSLLETDLSLGNVYVEGEISTFSPNKSGHIYFSIKDDKSLLQCVLFKWDNSLSFKPKTGDKVLLKGAITVYEPRGNYQLIVKDMKKAGSGDLYAKFLELKEKLKKQGYFDSKHKKQLVKIPKVIGVVSSPTGAVIQDIINTIKRRFPCVKVMLYPASVQGEDADLSVISGIKYFNNRSDIDTVIVARGGGSLEDLWCFNSQSLAKTILDSFIPIVSAVGHETDFTICDFVSDIRAPTPTAAAELSVPNLIDLKHIVDDSESRLNRSLSQNLEHKKIDLGHIESSLSSLFANIIESKKYELTSFEERIELLSCKSILKRGYSITLDSDGNNIKSVVKLKKKDVLTTVLFNGEVESIVKKTSKD